MTQQRPPIRPGLQHNLPQGLGKLRSAASHIAIGLYRKRCSVVYTFALPSHQMGAYHRQARLPRQCRKALFTRWHLPHAVRRAARHHEQFSVCLVDAMQHAAPPICTTGMAAICAQARIGQQQRQLAPLHGNRANARIGRNGMGGAPPRVQQRKRRAAMRPPRLTVWRAALLIAKCIRKGQYHAQPFQVGQGRCQAMHLPYASLHKGGALRQVTQVGASQCAFCQQKQLCALRMGAARRLGNAACIACQVALYRVDLRYGYCKACKAHGLCFLSVR